MSSATTFLRRALMAIINNKNAPWIALAMYILLIFLTFAVPTLFFSSDTPTNIVGNWNLGRAIVSNLLRIGLFITITWFLISKIIAPDTFISVRTFAALYLFTLSAAMLVTALLTYVLFLLHVPYKVLLEISGSTTHNIIHWSLFLSGLLLAKRSS